MPTLSFSCPKCDKNYDRVRQDIVGHKVKCDCGFVFRLGAKEDKRPGVAEKIQEKQRRKKKRRSGPTNSKPDPPQDRSKDLFLPPRADFFSLPDDELADIDSMPMAEVLPDDSLDGSPDDSSDIELIPIDDSDDELL